MSVNDLTSTELLERLKEDLDDWSYLAEVAKRSNDPDQKDEIDNSALDLFEASPDAAKSQSNCIGRQTCQPQQIRKPKALKDLIEAVQAAKSQKLQLRAMGSVHSFSNVWPTNGILLDPRQMNAVLPIDATVLKDPNLAEELFSVESGMKIKDLNQRLDAKGLALENMGAYDGQTIVGAISTGTHGTGISFGPIASSIRSLTLVSSSGTVYQIEPTNGITDPAKFSKPDVVLKQDDTWFNTTLIAMGCTGLIYSYTIHVVRSFYMKELRTLDTWENLKNGLKDGESSQILASHRGYELNINPYVVQGNHSCIQVLHDDTTDTKSSGDRGVLNWFAGLLASIPIFEKHFVKHLNKKPATVPSFINDALKSLKTPKGKPYVDKSYKVMNIGNVVNNIKAYALELSLPCDTNLVANVDKLLEFLGNTSGHSECYLTGPVNLRFVAASGAFLAPQARRKTCMVELDMLVGINGADKLFSDVKTTMCTPGSGIRVHWGLDPEDSISSSDVTEWYPDFPTWLAVYQELNADGMWNSDFTERLGISVP